MKKWRLYFFILLVLMCFTQLSFSQSVEELYSPYLLGLGLITTSFESPAGDILNPAVSGLKQRMTLDISYLGLPSFGDEEGFGHAANLGITIPTRAGVLSGSAHFITSPFSSAQLGTMGAAYVSFAKDLYPHFLIGAGLGTQFGLQDDFGGGGIGLDLGILHLAGDLAFLKDFRWGIAFRGLGWGYAPPEDTRLFPAAFTPSIGAHFKIIDILGFSVAFSPDISLPGIIPINPEQRFNLKSSIGCEIALFDTIFLGGRVMFDYLESRAEDSDRPFYTFGGAIKFKLPTSEKIKFLDISERGWDRSEIKANIVAVPLQNNIWGIGAGFNIPLGVVDATPPEITMETEKEFYVSPNHDGVQDDIVLPIKIEDSRYVKGYRFVITDENSNVIKTIENKEERQENVTFSGVLDRLTYLKKGILIPETIRWDGKSDQGTIVPDGKYNYTLESWDDNGNTAKSPAGTVTIDVTPPKAEVTALYVIFSPNNDGNKDTLPLEQTGSSEDTWKGVVNNFEGEEVASFAWENKAPENIEWNGTNNEGILVPDGVYQYILSSTDRAGNTHAVKVENIIINTQATPINITIGISEFSPDGDGIQDKLRFNLDIPVRTGLESWSLKVMNADGNDMRTFKGSAEIPDYIDFDGKDMQGMTLAETPYMGFLELKYVNGNNPTATSPEFVIDITSPRATVQADEQIFSPNNDGNKDRITFSNETSEEISWTGEIRDSKRNVVKKFTWRGRADLSVEWDGRGDDGILLKDDSFVYMIYSTDKAGNYGKSNEVKFELDTAETPVFVSTDLTHFSPNADGVNDSITIIPHLKVTSDVDTYTLSILDEGGKAIKQVTAKNKAPSNFKWDGKDDNGKPVPDAEYMAELNILYKNGNNPIAKTNLFEIDTVFPSLTLSTDYTLFSPDGDNRLDTFVVKQDTSAEDMWEGIIRNEANEVVRSYYWKGKASYLEWNGKDENGNKLKDGKYTYTIQSSDKAGNNVKKTIKDITIDTRMTQVFLTVDSGGFSPNGDKFKDTISFKIYVGLTDGIKSWNLEIINTETEAAIPFTGEKDIKTSFTWNGLDNGKLASEGFYYAALTVDYYKGNQPQAVTQPFRLDVSPPETVITIKPIPFSPDNDGIDDELYITTSIKDLSTVQEWKMEILDPMKNHFTSFQGKGNPAEQIIWDGISDSGELVQSADDYILEFNAQDDLGNKIVKTEKIPVDILVVKVGDKYKIKIPSITFKPNTADYKTVEEEKKIRNMKTLNRLAEIFKKYGTYHIIIEGHAVSLDWADPEKAKIEQEKELLPLSKMRAEAIKQGLVELGIEEWRISTVGIGGSQPVVPHGDLQNRWKNRRVEFLLEKKKKSD
ncbi:MAG: gliding motility-associated C-terminal domain-containing protein [Spirochaetales bacterium]|nr:gliding motility-associated C-terminal domain-containing protein [Spirochaetales bacterium]